MFINEAHQIRKSESSTSVRSQMWDSSDPQRNPTPLPLPERDGPISTLATQQKVSAAHKRLQSSSSLKTVGPDEASDRERERISSRTLYELMQVIHNNLETLMKRSQNNARDLGKLRGDVRNPQMVDDIKRLMQEASSAVHDPAQRTRLDVDLAHKLEELLRTDKVERPVQESRIVEDVQQIRAVLLDVQQRLESHLSQQPVQQYDEIEQHVRQLQQSVQTLLQQQTQHDQKQSIQELRHSIDVLLQEQRHQQQQQDEKELQSRQLSQENQQAYTMQQKANADILSQLAAAMENVVNWTKTVPSQGSEAVDQANQRHAATILAALQGLSTQHTDAYQSLQTAVQSLARDHQLSLQSLQASVDGLDTAIRRKTEEVAALDADLAAKQLSLKNLETRTALMLSTLSGMRRDVKTLKEEAASSTRLKKSTRRPPPVAAPLQQVSNRRIVSLTNMSQPSPFARPLEKQGSPSRKASWSKRVGNLFSTSVNKENVAAGTLVEVKEVSSVESRSVRSVSYRG